MTKASVWSGTGGLGGGPFESGEVFRDIVLYSSLSEHYFYKVPCLPLFKSSASQTYIHNHLLKRGNIHNHLLEGGLLSPNAQNFYVYQ